MELGSLWRDQTVVLFFLRRFGCQICRWTAAEVSKLEKDLKANGVALVGVGPEETGLKEFQEGGFFKGGEFIQCSDGLLGTLVCHIPGILPLCNFTFGLWCFMTHYNAYPPFGSNKRIVKYLPDV